MPPRHRKEMADEVNPPKLDDSRKQIAEKDCAVSEIFQ
jgi:hypothetical protein